MFCNLATQYVYMRGKLMNIDIQKGNRFYGVPYIRSTNGSKIILGANCRFRSLTKMSNQAGICRPCTIETLQEDAVIEIGENCGFSGTMVSAALKISIGNNVMCGSNSSITDTDWHGIHPSERPARYAKKKEVIIEDNVWLGMNVVVLKGSHIGENSIIGANSVVKGVIPRNVIAGGNPAVVIKALEF